MPKAKRPAHAGRPFCVPAPNAEVTERDGAPRCSLVRQRGIATSRAPAVRGSVTQNGPVGIIPPARSCISMHTRGEGLLLAGGGFLSLLGGLATLSSRLDGLGLFVLDGLLRSLLDHLRDN